MSRATSNKTDEEVRLPHPVIERVRWPWALIWLVPVLAAALAGYYVYDRMEERGPLITLRVADATGLKAGQSQVVHRGVPIGQVAGIELSPDQKQALLQIRLRRSDDAFARQGALFWIVRPEISMQEISGLATVLSGPVIDSIPGSGAAQTEFTALEKAPSLARDGLRIVLKTPNSQRLQADSPVYYRGIQVGFIEDVKLSDDATSADIHAVVQHRYIPLVKANSQFWVVDAVDFKGGLFSGIQVKVESLRSLISGGVAFATPEQEMGETAQNGAIFVLHDEPKKDWLAWAPSVALNADDGKAEKNPKPPKPLEPPEALRPAVGAN